VLRERDRGAALGQVQAASKRLARDGTMRVSSSRCAVVDERAPPQASWTFGALVQRPLRVDVEDSVSTAAPTSRPQAPSSSRDRSTSMARSTALSAACALPIVFVASSTARLPSFV
jgi:hypothetical protein